MSERMRLHRGPALWVALSLIALVVLTAAYVVRAHPGGDRNLAEVSILALQAVETGARSGSSATAQDLSVALGDNAERVDAFLLSDSAKRIPDVAEPVQAALTLFTVADQLWIASDGGDTQPAVINIAGAEDAITRAPELRQLVVTDTSGTLRFDNADSKAVLQLLKLAQAEVGRAQAAYEAN